MSSDAAKDLGMSVMERRNTACMAFSWECAIRIPFGPTNETWMDMNFGLSSLSSSEACMRAGTASALEEDLIWMQLGHISKGTPTVDIHGQRGNYSFHDSFSE